MKAIVFHGIGDIRLDDVPDPTIQAPTDAIVRLTASAICGTDLHFIRGSAPDMQPGTILGHEGVGIVEALGSDVRNLKVGDRVLIPSTIACGNCAYCRAGYFAQCDVANPNGKTAGTSFFGGPKTTGPFHGLQAEKARIPFANIGLIKLPDAISDDQAIAMSDIWPTAWFGAEMAEIKDGDTVAVFGCGPVGLFAIVSAKLMGAGRVFAIDGLEDRLARAQALGAECINFEQEDPLETIARLTGEIGVDCAIDAVGIDANHAHHGAHEPAQWQPGDEPSQALQWAVQAVAKAGTVSIIGVYPAGFDSFPIGAAMNKNLRLNMGNCHHRKYIPKLIEMTLAGRVDPAKVITQDEPLTDAISAFKAFDKHQHGWIKVKLEPGADGATTAKPTTA
ncbi:zinc-dependent alcohol dehydrogenase [Pseudomonas granadensis]|uniref:zinc-dependent alcohol dehydrogenase n=1 Tax=Pseudomonas granadensis TaxID=1421430 RepID=UPI00300E9A5C